MTVRTTTRGYRSAEKIARAIESREDFATSGALSGEARPHYDKYVIWSYNEPIAVIRYSGKRAIVSDYRHSVTTSRHRGHVLAALRDIDGMVIDHVGGRIFSDGQVR